MIDAKGKYHEVPADAHLGPFLTEQEVATLKDGEIVVVTWSGGNGPHSYEIQRNKSGDVCVVHRLPGIGPDAGRIYRHARLDFVGVKQPRTQVQRLLAP